jgi:DNA-binding response OmpR family regulator
MPTVLLVDGDVLVRKELAEFLRDCGLRVAEAASAAEARAFIADPDLGVDIALIDIGLAGAEDAFAFAAWLRHESPSIDVMLAGSPERAVERAVAICGGGPTLPKPYDPKAVLDRIKQRRAARMRGREA